MVKNKLKDYKRIAFTAVQQSYAIGTQLGTTFYADKIKFYATQPCYIRFNSASGLQHLVPNGLIVTFENLDSVHTIYVVRVSADGNLDIWADGYQETW